MSELNVAVIGCGVIAPQHIRSYQRIDGVTVKRVCDKDIGRARAIAGQFEIGESGTNAEDVAADPKVDCVSVCTDHASHAGLVEMFLEAGKHVLCEKALGATKNDLDRMMAAHAANPGTVFSGVFQHRFDRTFRLARELVQDGAFGTMLTASLRMACLRTNAYYENDAWRGTWDKEGGSVMINQAIHFIDTMDWVTGGVESLSATHSNLTHGDSIETEDTAVAAMRLKNGALATVSATSSSNQNWAPTISILGDEGSLAIRDRRIAFAKFADKAVQARLDAETQGDEEPAPLQDDKAYYGPSHPSQIADFIDAVREGRDPFITGQSARRAVDIVLAMYESHRTKAWVDVTH